MKDYYEILQVSPNAEPVVIASAYRRLARKYHPDAYDGPDATQRMRELNEAYEVLRDPARRAEYDRARRNKRQEARRDEREAASGPPREEQPRPPQAARTATARTGKRRPILVFSGLLGLTAVGVAIGIAVWLAVGVTGGSDDSPSTAEPTSEPALEPGPTRPVSEGDQSENLATRVYRYKPGFPDDVLPLDEANSCWVASIASNRSDAFRCVLGNFIHDPCFSVGISIGDDIMPVVCPGDPRTPSDDIAFTFDVGTVPVDPYFGAARAKLEDNVWFMVVDGQGCYALTGTVPSVGRKYYEFSCFEAYCTEPVQGLQGFVSDCWNPDTGEEKSVTLDAVWY